MLGHPIAGSEKSGVEAAKADLFVNHRVILTPTEETNPEALQAVKGLWQSTGAEWVEMPVAEHDEVLAATSHLPHILAYSLVDALAGGDEKQSIFDIAKAHSDVHGVHDIRTRQGGKVKFIQMHLELDDNLTLIRAHNIADEVEALIAKEFESEVDILIHLDPLSVLVKP